MPARAVALAEAGTCGQSALALIGLAAYAGVK
jgi:hypothetical protein